MSAMTTAPKAPVDATSRMKSIMSSTGMPRKNSSSTVVGMRMKGFVASRPNAKTMPSSTAPTIATAAARSVFSTPRPMNCHTSPYASTSQRDGSNMPGFSLPLTEICGCARRQTTQPSSAASAITPTIEMMRERRRARGPGAS